MLGIPTDALRPRMIEALDVIVRLLRGEIVTKSTEWFTLQGARLQLTPWSGDKFELAVTGTISTTGARAAGTHGIGLLSMAATTPRGFTALRSHWAAYEHSAAEHAQTVDRQRWRCVGPLHLAETRAEARREVAYGIERFARYFHHVTPGGMWDGTTVDEILASNDERRIAIIGTPEDAVERLRELESESGGFGTFLLMGHEWANPDATRRSLELFAQHVMPRFNNRVDAVERSWKWVDGSAERFAAANMAAIAKIGRAGAEVDQPD
jgi:limonene 1,2-monooxygenase